MTRKQTLDLYFMDARSKLIDIAAFLDRLEEAEGEADFRAAAFRHALGALEMKERRAKEVLLRLSDPSEQPVDKAAQKGACGAWEGKA